jgi:hypothetical protein
MVQKQPEKKLLYAVFGHFGALWAPPNRPKKVHKHPQVGKVYGPMSKLKKAPNQIFYVNKTSICKEKWPKTTRKYLFILFYGHLAPLKALKWA